MKLGLGFMLGLDTIKHDLCILLVHCLMYMLSYASMWNYVSMESGCCD